jgi:formylglycine-generating enzyme required for sulfatase activity
VDENTALALRQRLALATSPWALRALRAEAPGPAGRLQWSDAQRIPLLNWLREAEAAVAASGIAAGSLLDRALRFWEGLYERELNQERGDWQDTPAHQQMRMEHGLVLLWRQPGAAIGELYTLFHQGRLQELIRQQLERLAPLDRGTEQHIRLPWRWEERGAAERVMLQEMGFGEDMPRETLRRPGRLWLGLGACLGLIVGSWVVAYRSAVIPPAGPPIIEHGAGRPESAWEHVESVADDRWHVAVVTPKRVAAQEAPPAARVKVEWQPQAQPCIEVLPDGAELWLCGYGEAPLRLPEPIRHSLVVLVAASNTAEVENLAAVLLSSGSADVVLIDPHWPRHRQELLGRQRQLNADQQLLVIATGQVSEELLDTFAAGDHGALLQTDDWTQLVEGLKYEGLRSVAEAWPGLKKVIVGHPDQCWLRGVGGCLPQEEPADENGMVFVRLCPGTFLMGSTGYKSGQPVREVKVDEFWIGKYEVTRAQFQRFRKDYSYQKGEDDLPAANVNWFDAKNCCQHFGYQLPTEAEWEYAARAGTRTRYSFGDDEGKLGEYAWYANNSGNVPHPVGTRKPNPWGLYDLHGNVREWVQDCWHDNYAGAPVDGSAWETEKCQQRVLRGGSFFSGRSEEHLRSSDRGKGASEGQFPGVGFRCARGPRRQP